MTDSPLTRLLSTCSPEEAKELFTPERRSLRIHGHSTTIRLEQAFWMVLEGLAADEGTTISGLVTRINDHCQFSNQKNLASCLRVLSLKLTEGGWSPGKPTP